MMGLGALLFVVLVMLISEIFFSGSEIAVVASNKALLRERTSFGVKLERMVDEFRQRPQRLLGTVLIGTDLSVVISTSLVTLYLRSRFGDAGELYTLIIMSPLLLIFGEMIPKVVFQQYADRIAPRVLPLLKIFSFLFYPVLIALTGAADLLMLALGADTNKAESSLTREQLKLLLTSSPPEYIKQKPEHLMIRRVFRFSKTTVEEVMIPLIEVQAFEDSETVQEVKKKIRALPYSRYPIFRKRVDDVVGILDAFDLIYTDEDSAPVKSYMKPAIYVPETKPVDGLLLRMQKENFAMAIVVDEYGGCVGIITIEDILEEIVGEIEDEHDRAHRLYRALSSSRWLVQARMEIDRINEELGLDLPEGEDYETLGGFLLSMFKHIPRYGETLHYEDLTFFVRKANPRAIEEVLISRPAKPEVEKTGESE